MVEVNARERVSRRLRKGKSSSDIIAIKEPRSASASSKECCTEAAAISNSGCNSGCMSGLRAWCLGRLEHSLRLRAGDCLQGLATRVYNCLRHA